MEFKLCELSSIPDKQVLQFEIEGKTLLLWKDSDQIRVLDGVCPHRGAQLGSGIVENGTITCPWHDWSFDLATGSGLTNPMSCLETYEVSIRDGLVFVDLT